MLFLVDTASFAIADMVSHTYDLTSKKTVIAFIASA